LVRISGGTPLRWSPLGRLQAAPFSGIPRRLHRAICTLSSSPQRLGVRGGDASLGRELLRSPRCCARLNAWRDPLSVPLIGDVSRSTCTVLARRGSQAGRPNMTNSRSLDSRVIRRHVPAPDQCLRGQGSDDPHLSRNGGARHAHRASQPRPRVTLGPQKGAGYGPGTH
jgi:hypothetical protein